MISCVFKRYELKYLLTRAQYEAVKNEITSRLSPDVFGRNTVQSLYLDTDDFRLVRESIEKPVFKEKLRLRCYNLNLSGVLLLTFEKLTVKFKKHAKTEKIVKITIPESLDYTSVFDDVFSKYTVSSELEKVKSTNMGSMFRLSYRVVLKNAESEKPMLDEIRTRNGNLEIQSSRADLAESEL